MRRTPLLLAITLALGAGLTASGDVAQLTQPVINALTPIDSTPSSKQLNAVHNNDAQEALANLVAIALSENIDRGVQLRAVRALPQYCPLPCAPAHDAHATLITLITTPRYQDARVGSELLMLRATIEALGVLRVPDDVNLLVPQLNHPSRDIRAATARALRDLGNTQAIVPLRARYDQDQVDQVKFAISDALRVLGQPVP